MLGVEASRYTDPGPPDAPAQVAGEVFLGKVHGVEVFWVVAGQDVQHQGVVLHSAGDGTDVVETPGEWEDTALAHPPEARLHADGTAESCADTDGASRVRAERAVAQVCRDRSPRAAPR